VGLLVQGGANYRGEDVVGYLCGEVGVVAGEVGAASDGFTTGGGEVNVAVDVERRLRLFLLVEEEPVFFWVSGGFVVANSYV